MDFNLVFCQAEHEKLARKRLMEVCSFGQVEFSSIIGFIESLPKDTFEKKKMQVCQGLESLGFQKNSSLYRLAEYLLADSL